MQVILPTLGPERRATYSPILPIHPQTGIVMQVPMERVDRRRRHGAVARPGSPGDRSKPPVTGGACKLQWKADWAMRWFALDVDYEMSGKDLIDSVRLSSRICRILGNQPPEGFTYELFLDEKAQKISKSKGNGLSVDEWLRYAPAESLGQFMYNQPQRAKRLYFDVIPRAVDEYVANVGKAVQQTEVERQLNPAWHIHLGKLPNHAGSPVSFAMLLNLASVVNAETPDILWGFIRRYTQRRQRGNRTVPRPPGRSRHRLLPGLRPPQQAVPPAGRDRARGAGRPGRHAGKPCRRTAMPRRSRTRCTRSASGIPSSNCAPGSAACTRCCWASRKARASAASSRCTASRRPSP